MSESRCLGFHVLTHNTEITLNDKNEHNYVGSVHQTMSRIIIESSSMFDKVLQWPRLEDEFKTSRPTDAVNYKTVLRL
jgi:hypothetical protein